MRLFLNAYGLETDADQMQKYEFVVAIAAEHRKFERIVEWLENNVVDKLIK